MNENAKKWVEALKSGDYTQTKHILQNDEGYCCLGVACALYEKEGEGVLTRDPSSHIQGVSLPKRVQTWLGLEAPLGNFTEEKSGESSLVGLNDDKNWTFQQIAEFIESEPEGLFAKDSSKKKETDSVPVKEDKEDSSGLTPHVHQDVIKAWADGNQIQILSSNIWVDNDHPAWLTHIQYRVKPAEVIEIEEELGRLTEQYTAIEKKLNTLNNGGK